VQVNIKMSEDEHSKEYSINWIKGCLYNYLNGKGNFEKIKAEIQIAKRHGVSKGNFQIIIDAVPFVKKSERFKDILKIFKSDD
jgi:hypothetical protein